MPLLALKPCEELAITQPGCDRQDFISFPARAVIKTSWDAAWHFCCRGMLTTMRISSSLGVQVTSVMPGRPAADVRFVHAAEHEAG